MEFGRNDRNTLEQSLHLLFSRPLRLCYSVRLSVVCNVIVAKQCVLEQKLLLTAYTGSRR